jgi:hypothetical protein
MVVNHFMGVNLAKLPKGSFSFPPQKHLIFWAFYGQ